MKIRGHRFLAACIAAALLAGQIITVPSVAYTREAEDTSPVLAEAPQNDPAPETQPATEPPTQAPETEPPTEPPTQAPETEPPTQAPETEPATDAPTQTTEPETQAPSSETSTEAAPAQTQPAETSAQSESGQAKESETSSEKESETKKDKKKKKKEKKTTTVTGSSGTLSVTVTLAKKDRVPKSTILEVTRISKNSDPAQWKNLRDILKSAVTSGRRVLAGSRYYKIRLVSEDGKEITPSQKMTVSFSFGEPKSLKLKAEKSPEAGVYAIGSSAWRLGTPALTSGLNVKSFTVSGKNLTCIAVAGIQNKDNTGAPVSENEVLSAPGVLSEYLAGADTLEGEIKDLPEDVLIAEELEKEAKSDLPSADDVRAALEDLASYSVTLANAVSSDSVAVINLYADGNGNIDTTPYDVISGSIGGRLLLVNIAAASAGQSLTLPVLGAASQTVYNLVAWGPSDENPYVYEGTACASGTGIYMAGSGTISLSGNVFGAVYARNLDVTGGSIGVYTPEEETQTESATEQNGEDRGEETPDEALAGFSSSGNVTQASETLPETLPEAGEIETETENISEAVETESVSEPPEETESVTEGLEETESVSEEEALEADKMLAEAPEVSLYVKIEDYFRKTALTGTVTITWTDDSGTAYPVTADIPADGSAVLVTLPEELGAKIQQLSPGESVEVSVSQTGYQSGYKSAGDDAVTVKLTKPEDPEEKLTPEPGSTADAPISFNNIAETDVLINLKAVSQEDQTKELSGAEYSFTEAGFEWIKIEGDRVLVDADTLLTRIREGSMTQAVSLTAEEVKVPALWTISDSEKSRTITVTPSYDAETATASFTIASGETDLTQGGDILYPHTPMSVKITVTPVDQNGASVSGADYALTASGVTSDVLLKILATEKQGNDVVYTITPGNDDAAVEQLTKEGGTITVNVTETTIPSDYTLTDPVSAAVSYTISMSSDGKLQIDGASEVTGVFRHQEKPKTAKLTITLKDNKGADLRGTFNIKNSDGTFVATGQAVDGTLVLSTEGDPKFVPGTYTISQVGFDGGYVMASGYSADVTVTIAAGEEKTAEFVNVKSTSTEQIRLTKRTYVGTKRTRPDTYGMIYNPSGDTTYYVALFSDAAKTKRVTPLYALTVEKAHPYKILTISGLPRGTYYIGELDANGNLVPGSQNSNMWVTFSTSDTNTDRADKVVIAGTVNRHSITMNNRYGSLPSGFEYIVPVGLKKTVLAKDGSVDTSFNGKVRLRASYGSKYQPHSLTVTQGKSGVSYVYVPLGTSGASKEVRITELTEKKSSIKNTAILSNGKTYTVSMDKSRVTITKGDTAPVISVTNKEVDTSEDDTDGKEQAELKLTKKVTYKGQPIRVNSVYYIGIFDDAGLTKLRYKKGLQFKNASEVTSSLKINIYKLASKEVTFYFAEVDKNGKVVKTDGTAGYTITQNKQSITLNTKNLADELVVTNDVASGSKREKQLLDPASGFAGDTGALAEAQELEHVKNSSTKTVTADEVPVMPFATALVISGAVILAILVMRRKKLI